MRVLLTTDTIGGVWTYTKELAEGLLERFHAVALVSFGQPPSAAQSAWCQSVITRYSSTFRYVASDAPLEWMDVNETAYSQAEKLLCELAQNFAADLLHTNQFCFGKLPVTIPRLIGAHSDVLSWAVACKPAGIETSPWLNRYKHLVQTGLLSASAVVTPTRWMLQALSNGFDLPANTCVIPNGRDLPPTSTTPARKVQAVSVGRLWDPAKGLSFLTEVRSPMPLFVAGAIQHEAANAPTSLGSATHVGPLEEDALLELFRCSSIYLALSLYEPFGLAPLEAALCGCAVIAHDIPSFREVWGGNALYFEDAQSLCRLLAQLASQPGLLEEFRTRAHLRALQMSRALMVERYLDLYRQLLEPAYRSTFLHPSPRGVAHVS